MQFKIINNHNNINKQYEFLIIINFDFTDTR